METQDCTGSIRQIFLEGESNVGLVCEEILDMVRRSRRMSHTLYSVAFQLNIDVGGGGDRVLIYLEPDFNIILILVSKK